MQNEPIRIGVNNWPPCEVWYIAEAQGFFGDVEVELERYSAWRDNMSNFYRGKTDISHATYFNALYYTKKGVSAKIVITADTVLGSDGLVVDRAIEMPEGLIGKKIAVEINTDEHFLLNKALEAYGLMEGDVILIPATSKQAMELFVNGEVDACFTYNPYLNQAADWGNGTVVWTTEDAPGYMEDVLVVSQEMLNERCKEVQVVIEAWFKALEYIKANPDTSYALMAKNERMSPEVFGPFFSSFHFYSPEENMNIFRSEGFLHRLNEIGNFLEEHHSNNVEIDMSKVYTDKIISGIVE
ncbi:MAG: ABC transporter substrate-binding protein [Spirochaetia bacterium]|nr:ABC transporter substrate-binding protein [Spirochaetia bacterium]